MNVNGIIFDLDGTLVDSAEDILESIKESMNCLGVKASNKLKRSVIGPPVREILQNILGPDHPEIDAVVDKFRSIYDNSTMQNTIKYKGVDELLLHCRNLGIRLFVATNKPEKATSQVIEKHFKACFEGVICIDTSIGKNLSKKEMIQHVVKNFSMVPSETLMVGDGKSDMEGAVLNKCIPVGALYGYSSAQVLSDAGARYLINSPLEILQLDGIKR